MQLYKIVVGQLKSNCYIVKTENNSCFIIDPGSDFDKIDKCIVTEKLIPKYIFLTHGHYDHIGAVPNLKVKYPDVKICISKEDSNCLMDGNESLANIYGGYKQLPVQCDVIITDGLTILIDDVEVFCISTPGHTVGGVSYLVNQEVLFTGDVLFKGSVGRTDLNGGNSASLKDSIKKLYKVLAPSELKPIKIYPGHYFASSLEKEKLANQYVIEYLNN